MQLAKFLAVIKVFLSNITPNLDSIQTTVDDINDKYISTMNNINSNIDNAVLENTIIDIKDNIYTSAYKGLYSKAIKLSDNSVIVSEEQKDPVKTYTELVLRKPRITINGNITELSTMGVGTQSGLFVRDGIDIGRPAILYIENK